MLYKKLCTSLLFLGLLPAWALHGTPTTGLTKYQKALLCYEAKDYYEALRLLEEILPTLRGKKEEAAAYFYQAYCSFYRKDYVQSAERFGYVYEKFLGDARVEEAMYMQGHALYLASPDVKLDQVITQEAAHALRSYLSYYPGGVYASEASVQLRVLDNKLALKDFNNAKYYCQLDHYRAAVVSLGNFQKDFSDSPYHEEAAYLKADAQCRYLKKTDKNDQEQQLIIAIKYCREFLDHYPASHYAAVVERMFENLSPSSVNKSVSKEK
jgi:outer membrane protein assembly factor BamD